MDSDDKQFVAKCMELVKACFDDLDEHMETHAALLQRQNDLLEAILDKLPG